jgi:probable phosphoglycerate mutase
MPIRGFLRDALDAGTAAYWRPQISPCSITAIRFWGNEEAEVQTVNFTAHLS